MNTRATTRAMNEILPFLYLGDQSASEDIELLKEHKIKFILNATSDLPNVFEPTEEKEGETDHWTFPEANGGTPAQPVKARKNTSAADVGEFTYFQAGLDDDPFGEESLEERFEPTVEFIEKARTSGHRCLVHCRAGRSRSAALVLAYLMIKKEMTLAEAYLVVSSKRPIVYPNKAYMKELETLDAKLHGKVSFDRTAHLCGKLVSMGFEQEEAMRALSRAGDSLETAISLLLSC